MMTRQNMTYTTAMVVVPPEEVWEPIQAIRRDYDSKIQRWMPHITLFYPFFYKEQFASVKETVASHLASFPSFTLNLRELFYFTHGLQKYTLWLGPEPKGSLMEIHDTLAGLLAFDRPATDELRFKPHLSVGQIKGKDKLDKACSLIREYWKGVSFEVKGIQLLWRNDPPDDVFRISDTIPLGPKKQG